MCVRAWPRLVLRVGLGARRVVVGEARAERVARRGVAVVVARAVLGDVALVDCGEASPGGSAQALEDVEAQVEAALAKARGVAAAGTPAAPDDDEPPPWVRPSSVGERPPPPRSEVNVVADDGELYALD